MDEMQNTPIQEQAAEAPETTVDSHDDWDDIDLSGLVDEDDEQPAHQQEEQAEESKTPEADQQDGGEEAKTPEPETQTQPEAEEGKEDQLFFDLKQFGEVRRVNKDEVIALAQKGMNYDHIRGERDTARQRTEELEAFLREMAEPSGMSIEELMNRSRAEAIAEREGIDRNLAYEKVKLANERRAMEAERNRAQQQIQQEEAKKKRENDNFLRFFKEYPDVDAKTIPREVWDRFRDGADLTDAYSRWENKQLKDQAKKLQSEIDSMKQNQKNQERTTGSQKSVGSKTEMSELDKLWYDGT